MPLACLLKLPRTAVVEILRPWRLVLSVLLLSLLWSQPASAEIVVVVIGDSTVNNSGGGQAGWGSELGYFFDQSVVVRNRAVSGRSSKSFILEGRWTPSLALNPDYVLVQFGHNDQKLNDTSRGTYLEASPPGVTSLGPYDSFQGNLTKFVTESRAIGAEPILISSVARRGYTVDEQRNLVFDNTKVYTNNLDRNGNGYSLFEYAQAALAVGHAQNAPTVDLNSRSLAYYQDILNSGQSLDGLGPDRTHFYPESARAIAKLVVRGLLDSSPDSPLAAAVVPHTVYTAGDLDKNDVIDDLDWLLMATSLGTNVGQLSPIEAYLQGDLNLDGEIDRWDQAIFEDHYDSTRYSGAFARAYLMAGDVNDDGIIDLMGDFEVIRANLLTDVSARWEGDLNNDGQVDLLDFDEWKTAYLAMGGDPAAISFTATIPEPATVGWAMIGIVGALAKFSLCDARAGTSLRRSLSKSASRLTRQSN